MIRVKEAVIVEGRYDRIKLSSLIDGLIIETGGFRVFKDKERLSLIRRLAKERGILILTDSDSAGFLIRNYLSGAVPKESIKHAYIPDVLGKEKRKEKPSKEGKLGVEGVSQQVLLKALERAGAIAQAEQTEEKPSVPISKTDLYLLGLSGGESSALKRNCLLKELELPEYLSANSFLQVLNCLMTLRELRCLCERLFSETETSEAENIGE